MDEHTLIVKQLARDISEVENGGSKTEALLDKAWKSGKFAYRIGVTGPPGAGKSTLVNCLAAAFSDAGKRTAVISVDPSSPFTGGAILGDRIRMNALSGRENVYIRSMASRGSLGGLSLKTHDVCDILDGYGFDIILIETVGVGQIELDIAQAADVTLTVLVPESGDDIQAMKAGIMEISDIFIVNKADRHGVEAMIMHLRSLIALRKNYSTLPWEQPVLRTIATSGDGVEAVLKALHDYRDMLEKQQAWHSIRSERMKNKVFQIVNDTLSAHFWTPEKQKLLRKELQSATSAQQSPFRIAEKLLATLRKA
ncbi:MAG: methylmalonyl Co-A mutase-associated GTPase MeaB [Candidatus Neomarinimicrobiota bacterium]|jgi:LAO/AO transport system kinase|nr:methylmalonyl Co-A mutase-associated GTPase MeaB [Candidatus Neomarinimicrobiota bacterium]MDD3966569.1 methylmalonyl Co-A mutase-associated GTPase MeaB [Candidatus Neomarinimicrobiota bacterium]MDX9780496.1 methylmalonyl Co-A mutase-associated GTPase MeaB [bacterium]